MAARSRDREYESGERIPGTEYVVIRLEARGGHGALYLVRHHYLSKKLQMLKTLRAFEPNEELVERLQREAQMLAGMEHPHIVSVVSGGLTDEPQPRPYFVMERLRGRPLSVVLPKTPDGVGLEATLRISMELAEAVDYVHREHGVVHRDIKPDNIFIQLTPSGTTTKLLDFGVLHMVSLDKRHTNERAFIGTPRYASPEQLFGDRPTAQTDLYALGLVMHELLTGHHPFGESSTLAGYAKAHLSETPLPFPDWVGAPERLERLVMAMLAKKPGDRPPSAEYVRFELGQIQQRAQVGDVGFSERDVNQTDPTPFANVLTMTRGDATDPGGPPDFHSDPAEASPRVGGHSSPVPVVSVAGRPRLAEKTVEDPPLGFLATQPSPVPAPPARRPVAAAATTQPLPSSAPTNEPVRSTTAPAPVPAPRGTPPPAAKTYVDADVITALVRAAKNEEPDKRAAVETSPTRTSAPSETAMRATGFGRKSGLMPAMLAGAVAGMALVTAWVVSRQSASSTASTPVPVVSTPSAVVPTSLEPLRGDAPAGSAIAPPLPSAREVPSQGQASMAPSSEPAPRSPSAARPSPSKDDMARSIDPEATPSSAPSPTSPTRGRKHLPGSGL